MKSWLKAVPLVCLIWSSSLFADYEFENRRSAFTCYATITLSVNLKSLEALRYIKSIKDDLNLTMVSAQENMNTVLISSTEILSSPQLVQYQIRESHLRQLGIYDENGVHTDIIAENGYKAEGCHQSNPLRKLK